MNARLKKAYDWVNERVHLEDLVNFLGKKYGAVHPHSIWYYFGGGTLFFFHHPCNNAVKEIRVQLLADRGIENPGGGVSFYASDKVGKVVNIYGEAQLPNGFESANVIILRGHLTQSGFHVHEILLD